MSLSIRHFVSPFRILLAGAILAHWLPATARADNAVAAPHSGYHVINKYGLPGNEGWDYIKADGASHRLYISRGVRTVVFDTQTGKTIGEIPNTNGVHGIALAPALNRGFISDGKANTVTVFNLKTLKPIQDVPVGDGPDCIIFDDADNLVFTFNGRGHTATAIDAATATVVGTVALPGKPEFAVADGHGHVYDNIEDLGEIVSIDAKTLKVDGTIPLAPAESPSGLTMDRVRRRLFAVCDNGQMAVVDPDAGKVVARPAIGNGPDATNFDPSSRLVFSPNGEDGTLTVIRQVTPDDYVVIDTIPTQTGARTLTLDETTHHLFTVTATPVPASAGATGTHRRRQYEPGSFVVLELAP